MNHWYALAVAGTEKLTTRSVSDRITSFISIPPSPARVAHPARPCARGADAGDSARLRGEIALDQGVVVRRLVGRSGGRCGPDLRPGDDVAVVHERRLGDPVGEPRRLEHRLDRDPVAHVENDEADV